MPLKFLLSALLLVLQACALSPAEPANATDAPALAGFSSAEAAAEFHLMAGELAAQRQQPLAAARHLLQAMRHVPDAEIAMRATSFALAGRDEALALVAAKRWLLIDRDNMEAAEAVARLMLRNDQPAEAMELCAYIIESHPGGTADGFRQVALLLSHEGDRQEAALRIMERLQQRWPELAGGYYAQSLLALRFGNLDLAEGAARSALGLDATSRDSLLLLVGVLVKKGDLAGADRSFSELIAGSERPADLRMGYARLLLDGNHKARAADQFQQVIAVEPANADALYALGLLALEAEDMDTAEGHFTALLKVEGRSAQGAYYLGRIADQRRQFETALLWYAKVDAGPMAIDAAIHRAFTLGELKRIEEARSLMRGMRAELPPARTRFYLAEGEMLLAADRAADALALYQQALDDDPDEPDILYGRSLVYERLGNLVAAEADLRAVLAQDGNDARALNALGYLLSVHTDRLGEARTLVSRALELTPDDAAVIDSMGWIEFRMGKVEAARALLQKAFDRLKDPEIAAHLGEVLWVLGHQQDARAIWAAALKQDPDHRVLRETVQRLTQ